MLRAWLVVAAVALPLLRPVGAATAPTETAILESQGAACLAVEDSDGAAGRYFHSTMTHQCELCPNASYNALAPQVAAMRPVNFGVLRVMRQASPCFCDMSAGLANGDYVKSLEGRGSDPTTATYPPLTFIGRRYCVDCRASGTVPSIVLDARSMVQGCVRCGTLVDVFGSGGAPAAASGLLANATYSASAPGACACPAGFVITETLGDRRLPVQICVRCDGETDARDPSACTTCVFPSQFDAASGECGCAAGFTRLSDGSCQQSSRLGVITQMASGSLSTAVTPRNWLNTGAAGPSTESGLLSGHLTLAATNCLGGTNSTACELLTNLCVLASYDPAAAPCAIYAAIHALETCRGTTDCEIPQTLPWLYYVRSTTSAVQDADFVKSVTLKEDLEFVLSAYSWNGTWLGTEPLVEQLQNCEMESQSALDFFSVGSTRRLACNLYIPQFIGLPQTAFYELFIRDDAQRLFPVPVLVDYSTADLQDVEFGDSRVYGAAACENRAKLNNCPKRRFFVYDNVGGRAGQWAEGDPAYVTFARTIRLMVDVSPDHSSTISVPLLILQYASWPTAEFLSAATPLSRRKMHYVRTRESPSAETTVATISSTFTREFNEMNKALMGVTIGLCVGCLLSALVRTYGWMRRQQELRITGEALARFFFYYCNHIANSFALVVVVTCAVIYVFFRGQTNVDYMLPTRSDYVAALLYTSVIAKGLVVAFKIVEQCNADVFVIDWERSKGQLLREAVEAPISMWRSTFIANELNEMQTLRGWRPLFTMMLILLFLEGFDHMSFARSTPYASTSTADATAPTNNFLRIAVAAFYWIAIAGFLHFCDFIYHSFITVHPLKGIADLLSVSNISVMILIEPQWGFYLHGESIHAHSDISMEDFQDNLKRESQGNMPARGLGGQEQCQTFEVFIGTYMRQYLYACYANLAIEYQKALGGEVGRVTAGKHRGFIEFIRGGQGKTLCFTDATLAIKRQINEAFTQSVRGAEKSLMAKFPMHQFLDFPPNILFMNGPLSGDAFGKDLYFLDSFSNWGRWLLYGIDFDIFILYMVLFFAIDTSLHNSYAAMAICYVLDALVVFYRAREGQANLGAKTLFDERFFL